MHDVTHHRGIQPEPVNGVQEESDRSNKHQLKKEIIRLSDLQHTMSRSFGVNRERMLELRRLLSTSTLSNGRLRLPTLNSLEESSPSSEDSTALTREVRVLTARGLRLSLRIVATRRFMLPVRACSVFCVIIGVSASFFLKTAFGVSLLVPHAHLFASSMLDGMKELMYELHDFSKFATLASTKALASFVFVCHRWMNQSA